MQELISAHLTVNFTSLECDLNDIGLLHLNKDDLRCLLLKINSYNFDVDIVCPLLTFIKEENFTKYTYTLYLLVIKIFPNN